MTAAPSATDDGDDPVARILRLVDALWESVRTVTESATTTTSRSPQWVRTLQELWDATAQRRAAMYEQEQERVRRTGAIGSIAVDLDTIKRLLAYSLRVQLSFEGDRDGAAEVEHDTEALRRGDFHQIGRAWAKASNLVEDGAEGLGGDVVAGAAVDDGGHNSSPSDGADTSTVGEGLPGLGEEASPGSDPTAVALGMLGAAGLVGSFANSPVGTSHRRNPREAALRWALEFCGDTPGVSAEYVVATAKVFADYIDGGAE